MQEYIRMFSFKKNEKRYGTPTDRCEKWMRNRNQQDVILFLNLFPLYILHMLRIEQLFTTKKQLLYMQHMVYITHLR